MLPGKNAELSALYEEADQLEVIGNDFINYPPEAIEETRSKLDSILSRAKTVLDSINFNAGPEGYRKFDVPEHLADAWSEHELHALSFRHILRNCLH